MDHNAKKYNNIKLTVGILEGVFGFVLLFVFLKSGMSNNIFSFLSVYFHNSYLQLLTYVLLVSAGFSILSFPVSFYSEFYLEHKFNLSNQTFTGWLWENTKAMLVGLAIGLPVLLLFYYILLTFGTLWWLPFAIIMFIISVILAQLLPVVILPIFYKVSDIDNPELKEKIKTICQGAGLQISNVFQFDMSKNTKKANAAFAGLGKTKRILLGDTLVKDFTEDEIETVIAHEVGHYKYKHIQINLLISTITSFGLFYIISVIYSGSLNYFGFSKITDIAALPLIIMTGMVLGLIQTPLVNMLSRKFEYQADTYAVNVTGKAEIFIETLEKLNKNNLGDSDPHPFVEWYFYSHPSVKNRIRNIQQIISKAG